MTPPVLDEELVMLLTSRKSICAVMLLASIVSSACVTRNALHNSVSTSAASPNQPQPDPVQTDPDKYKSIFENEQVRVLRYHDAPGGKTHMHYHCDTVMYALSSFKRRLTFANGTSKELSFSAGDVMWVAAQSHMGHNIGTTDTDVLLVEQKH